MSISNDRLVVVAKSGSADTGAFHCQPLATPSRFYDHAYQTCPCGQRRGEH
jgi:hypothetical protein